MNSEAHHPLRSHRLALIVSVIGLVWVSHTEQGIAQISPVGRALSPFHKQILSMGGALNASSGPDPVLGADAGAETALTEWTPLPSFRDRIVDCAEHLPPAYRYATAAAGAVALAAANLRAGGVTRRSGAREKEERETTQSR